jgi:hypothetical protein
MPVILVTAGSINSRRIMVQDGLGISEDHISKRTMAKRAESVAQEVEHTPNVC